MLHEIKEYDCFCLDCWSTMARTALVLFIGAENCSAESSFKENLQKMDQAFNVYDVESISRMRGGKEYKDKLKYAINHTNCIIIVCSPAMKSFLDDGKSLCNYKQLKRDERNVLLEGLRQRKQKVILVYLNDNFSGNIPKVLEGIGSPVDGVNDMDIVGNKILALLPNREFINA